MTTALTPSLEYEKVVLRIPSFQLQTSSSSCFSLLLLTQKIWMTYKEQMSQKQGSRIRERFCQVIIQRCSLGLRTRATPSITQRSAQAGNLWCQPTASALASRPGAWGYLLATAEEGECVDTKKGAFSPEVREDTLDLLSCRGWTSRESYLGQT